MNGYCSGCRHWKGAAGPGIKYCHRFMPKCTLVGGKQVYEATSTPDGPCIYNPSEFSAPSKRFIMDPYGKPGASVEIETAPHGEESSRMLPPSAVTQAPAAEIYVSADSHETAPPEIAPVYLDKNGLPFDPRIHETDANGNPVMARNGTIRMKRGQLGKNVEKTG